ncbi:MAG: hypothetical protein H7Y38_08890 [Armatimonadetes bacterium]|nr:hypothetical protein [Armatimonadota bacterium]
MALTANYETNDKSGALVTYPVKASTMILAGALVAVDDATGLLVKASDATGKTFAGVAYEAGSNATGADAAIAVRARKTGTFVYAFSGAATQSAVGKKAYAVDDNTVALAATTTNDVYVGDIVAVSGGKVRVRIDRAVG